MFAYETGGGAVGAVFHDEGGKPCGVGLRVLSVGVCIVRGAGREQHGGEGQQRQEACFLLSSFHSLPVKLSSGGGGFSVVLFVFPAERVDAARVQRLTVVGGVLVVAGERRHLKKVLLRTDALCLRRDISFFPVFLLFHIFSVL